MQLLLAKQLDADMLIILTAVEKVAINFGKENEEWLSDLTVEQAEKYVNEGHFAAGSMLPKVQAAMDFASSKEGRTAMITLLKKQKMESRAKQEPLYIFNSSISFL